MDPALLMPFLSNMFSSVLAGQILTIINTYLSIDKPSKLELKEKLLEHLLQSNNQNTGASCGIYIEGESNTCTDNTVIGYDNGIIVKGKNTKIERNYVQTNKKVEQILNFLAQHGCFD